MTKENWEQIFSIISLNSLQLSVKAILLIQFAYYLTYQDFISRRVISRREQEILWMPADCITS